MCGVAGCDSGEGPPQRDSDGSIGAADAQLVAYDSCASVLATFKQAALRDVARWTPARLESPHSLPSDKLSLPAEGGTEHSSTTVHEPGVDEPDVVKTDGHRLVTAVGGKLRVVDVTTRKEIATADLDGGEIYGLMLDGDRALAVMRYVSGPRDSLGTRFVQVDLTTGRVTGELTVDGQFVDARVTDGIARLVLSSRPQVDWDKPISNRAPEKSREQLKRLIRNSTVDDWLPHYSLRSGGSTSSGRLVDCSRVYHPKPVDGVELLTVLTLDIDGELAKGDPVSVSGDGSEVYSNGKNLYVIDGDVDRFDPYPRADVRIAPMPRKSRTKIYQFDIAGENAPEFVASGTVDGKLLNQYSISEHDGFLRAATTTTRQARLSGRPDSESVVTVLRARGEKLERVGSLGGLGKGERIHSVRFLGDVGYVVTFREVDPLYRIDLSDPRNPKLDGELKITGYSSYLHPVAEGRLLGIGQEATTEGRSTGLQISLFDIVSDAPQRLDQLHMEGGVSDAEHDPHAFLYWPERDLVVVPIGAHPEQRRGGALVLRIEDDHIERVGLVRHTEGDPAEAQVVRSVVVNDTLWTVSAAGAQVNDLDDLDRLDFLAFD